MITLDQVVEKQREIFLKYVRRGRETLPEERARIVGLLMGDICEQFSIQGLTSHEIDLVLGELKEINDLHRQFSAQADAIPTDLTKN